MVGEPSVEDTIAILRGLKPRYEAHHKGVRIKDSALVAAANLSHRYIADRFLPDKAIDLMDEATSRLAMELESVPGEIDQVQRRLVQLELADRQLADETEEHAQERRAEVQEEMAELRKKLADLRAAMGAGKERAGRRAANPPAADGRRVAIQPTGRRRSRKSSPAASSSARRTTRSSTSWTSQRKKLADQLESRRRVDEPTSRPSGARRLLRRRSGPEEIAEVVSAWTGIPVSRMMETERAKLLVLEDRIHQRLVGPGRGGRGRGQRRAPQPLRPARPQPAHRLVHLPRAHRRGQDRTVQGPGRGDVRQRRRHDPPRHERVHGAAHGQPADRRPAGLRRLRGGRHADRGRPPPALLP